MGVDKKTILVLTNVSGGLYSFRKELLAELVKTNHVYVATQFTTRIEELKQIGVDLIDIPVDRRGINLITDLTLLINYIKTIKSLQPDLVITYTIKPNVYGGIASRICRVNYVANITGLGTAFQKVGALKSLVIRLHRIALKKAQVVFFENSENRDFMVDTRVVKKDRCCIMPGAGVNLDQYTYQRYPQNNNPFIFLFVGRVMKEKGINELFGAMMRLREDGYECVLDVLGGFEEDYKDFIDKYTDEGWLRYHGFQDDVIPFIQKANCFVLPSWHEGMANANLECASVGRPIITSDIPGCKEAIIDNKTGYLCQPKDVNSLYTKMRDMIALSDKRREQMGIDGRKHMEIVFDKKSVVKNTIEHLCL